LSYSHTPAQLKVIADIVFLRTNPLWTKKMKPVNFSQLGAIL